MVKAITLQKITVGGNPYEKGAEVDLPEQRFESYLSIGAVKAAEAVEECPMPPVATVDLSIPTLPITPTIEVPVVESTPKYLGIEPKVSPLLDRPIHPATVPESPEIGEF